MDCVSADVPLPFCKEVGQDSSLSNHGQIPAICCTLALNPAFSVAPSNLLAMVGYNPHVGRSMNGQPETSINCVFMFYCYFVFIVCSSIDVFYTNNFMFFFTLQSMLHVCQSYVY